MTTILTLVLGSLKALLLLIAAGGFAFALRNRSARLRAAVWGTALAGCLVIPAVAPFLPELSLPVPEGLAQWATADQAVQTTARIDLQISEDIVGGHSGVVHIPEFSVTAPPARNTPPINWKATILAVWAVGFGLMLLRLAIGLWRMTSCLRASSVVDDAHWLGMLAAAREQTGCRRKIRLLTSTEVEIPATVGVFRPAIVLPLGAERWVWGRRQAVLLHETVHIARFDWPMRTIARLTRAAYWFNPLAWWATRRLDLEQELACDEEVIALGTRASSYACHLLGIARNALPCPAPAIPALGMARRTHMEERIMSILDHKNHRRVGTAVLIPAIIAMAAMVPALAAVYPSDPQPREAGSELKQIATEMASIEAKMEPFLATIEDIQIDMEPQIEMLSDIEITIDDEKIAEIEAKMEPYLERLEAIEIDMEPFVVKMDGLQQQLEGIQIHIEDGTLAEVQEQIHEQMSIHMSQLEDLHVNLEPFHEQMEQIHQEMEHLHEEMAEVHIDMEPIHAQMEQIHIDMEPFHEQMEKIHKEMEPFHEEMERLGERFEDALETEVESYLREKLGSVTAPDADFSEAAQRIVDDAHINVDDEMIRFRASKTETRQILTDLFSDQRIGTQSNFDSAIEDTVIGLSPLTISMN